MAWALKKGCLFLLGHSKFTIFADHSPLVHIFGSKSLGDIENVRLQKQKDPSHIKQMEGIKKHAYTFSCYPVNKPDEEDVAEAKYINSIEISSLRLATQIISTTLDTFKEHATSDQQCQKPLEKINKNTLAVYLRGTPCEGILQDQRPSRYHRRHDHLHL